MKRRGKTLRSQINKKTGNLQKETNWKKRRESGLGIGLREMKSSKSRSKRIR